MRPIPILEVEGFQPLPKVGHKDLRVHGGPRDGMGNKSSLVSLLIVRNMRATIIQ